ncbi:LuxR family transcriptional regulator [Methylopila capsulata]|uniref:LuxR family transcriptional regulator n=1 Tax=Methylopila capsulata TaxID=61654 RepID=A0A9W6MSS3_9HYPH|nr:autoinducer binding domain-containing protein [Methylopila capsulata]MBM7852352.1 LuxR family transcriptional regulator [Methylopila capsulata]GLK56562.1 LuxR family transcriptional regulator [Methylopila capsulata]
MRAPSPDSVRDHFAGRAPLIQNFGSALDVLSEITSDLGFTQVLYGYLPTSARLPNGEWLPLKLNVRNFPHDWEDEWTQFMSVDPYYRACFDGIMPLEWAEVQARPDLTAKQRAACDYLGDFGLSHGITVPVHLPFGRFAVVSAIADRSCANWTGVRERAREPLHWLTHDFTQFVLDRGYEDQIETIGPVRLTPREIECLKWASAGKTSSETAIIIGRSVETVRLHLKNAIRKLDACNRAQAVAGAVQMGLI